VGLNYPTLRRDGIWRVYPSLSLSLSRSPLARTQRPYMVVGGRHGDAARCAGAEEARMRPRTRSSARLGRLRLDSAHARPRRRAGAGGAISRSENSVARVLTSGSPRDLRIPIYNLALTERKRASDRAARERERRTRDSSMHD